MRICPSRHWSVQSHSILGLIFLLCWGKEAGAWIRAGTAPEKKGTIAFALYTVQKGVLKMTAQLYPLAIDTERAVQLDLWRDEKWSKVTQAPVVEQGWTAHFRLENWDASRDVKYRLRHGWSHFEGLIRHDPVEKEIIVAAAFTGNSPGPGGGKISKRDLVENVSKVDPDVLLFTGDQVYNHDKHTAHWIQFGETFRDLIRNRPTVTIPDDHDVGHPNLWGHGGRPAKADWDGGYLKPADYVNMVQRQQTAHLPDPYDPTPVEQGITVYYTSLNVGGVDFAILEDRKWKSGCQGLVPPGLGPRPDHIDQPNYDPKAFDLPGLQLLGERQETFLAEWGRDWTGVIMKAVVSQTVFGMASTHHSQNKNFYYADFDANGWPQSARNRAVDLMRRCFAFHICGDQHLSLILQYGIDDWRDAGWAFCVPSIANLWPRWWEPKKVGLHPEPGAQEHTGDFLDGFGNRLTVYAHTNPVKTGREPAELHDRMPGFGLISFHKKTRQITMECWPRMTDPTNPDSHQYTGWPRTIHQYDNYGRKAAAYLPTLKFQGGRDPLVQVVEESTQQVLYTVRAQGDQFRPKVFKPGNYTVRIQFGPVKKSLTGLAPLAVDQAQTVEVVLP